MKSKVHSSTQYMNLKMIWILSSTFENGNAKMMKSKEKKMTTLTPTFPTPSISSYLTKSFFLYLY